MRIKSYFAGTIREAIEKARRELGAEAMIIASHKTGTEQEHHGEYEVVCGVAEEVVPERGQGHHGAASKPRPPIDADALLRSAGFDDKLRTDILAAVARRVRKRSSPADALAAELAGRLAVLPEIGRPQCSRRVVALVGPPGAGKTTTLVKLAVRYGLTARMPMHIVSMDGYRVAGADALRTYTAAMGAGFDALETAASLAQTLEQHSGKGLILIDTPGLGPADMTGAAQLASFLSRQAEADVHLVLPAYLSLQDMAATVGRFRPFLPSKLLLTGADMATSLGPAIAQALLHEKPVSFLGTGQQIPEDLLEATAERLLERFAPLPKQESAISAA